MKAVAKGSKMAVRTAAAAGRRGRYQGVRQADGTMSWPNGFPPAARERRWDGSIADQIRYEIAWSEIDSPDLAEAAGIPSGVLDRFMGGDDVLSLAQADQLAQLLGMRLASQDMLEALWSAWEQAGGRVLSCPPNLLAAAAWRRARSSKA